MLCSTVCNILFPLRIKYFFLTLSTDHSARVPPKTERGKIEKNERELLAGTVHEMHEGNKLLGK